MHSSEVIKSIENGGWQLVKAIASHHHFQHPEKTDLVTVPHPVTNLPRSTVNPIFKQAGLNNLSVQS